MKKLTTDKMFILAAGFGTRLLPLTRTIPKPLIPFCSDPLIKFIISYYKSLGIKSFAINAHHLSDKIVKFIQADGEKESVKIFIEDEILGTGGGIRNAAAFFEGCDFLTANVDCFATPDIAALYKKHTSSGAAATMLLKKSADAEKRGAIGIDSAGRVVSILNSKSPTPPKGNVEKLMYTGVQIIGGGVFDLLPESETSPCIIRQGYIPALEAGVPIYALEHKGYFNDVGTLREYLEACFTLLSGDVDFKFAQKKYHRRGGGLFFAEPETVCTGVEFTPPVCIAKDVTIAPGAKIGPDTVIESGAKIGDGAIIKNSFISHGSVVEANEIIDKEIVHNNR